MSQITDWLTKLGACTDAIKFLASATTASGGVASLQRPDWLLWFYFAQSTDPSEKKRVLGILYTMMAPTITSTTSSSATVSAAIGTALSDVSSSLSGTTLDPNVVLTHLKTLMNLATSTRASQQAIACAVKMLQVAVAAPGIPSAGPASHLGKHWMKLQELLGTLPSDKTAPAKCAAAIRAAIPLKNLTGLPT